MTRSLAVQSLRRVPLFAVVMMISSLIAAVGCGSGGGSPVLIHTTGHFSNASLNGSYVYQVHGATANGTVYRQVGVFAADGKGNITGTDDSSFSAVATAITGTYTVGSDGTGFITFNTSSLGSAINFAITLISSSSLDLIENDPNVNAAGVAQAQGSTSIATTPSGTFVFRLHQEQSAQNPSTQEASQVGAFTVANGTGTGAIDQDLGNQSATFSSPTITVSFAAPEASGRGTASWTDNTNFKTGLVYYIVNSSRLVLLVDPTVNPNAVGSGNAEAQAASANGGLSGSYAFGSRGDDFGLNAGGLYGVATVGQFNANNGSISGIEDVMEDGNYSPSVNLGGCYTTGAAGAISGRVVMTNCQSQGPVQVFWMVNSSRAFFLDLNSGQFQDGTADLQTTNSFSASTLNGQFALVMDGLDLTPTLVGGGALLISRIGAMQFNGSASLNLSELVNEFNGGANPGGLNGHYNVSASGRITGTLANTNGGLDVVMYAISGSQAYVMQQDSGWITSGTVQIQQ
jgi:hypothetical protein